MCDDVGNLKEEDAESLHETILMFGSGIMVFWVSAWLFLPYVSMSYIPGVSLHKQLPIPTSLLEFL